ncbi:MAG TPA: glutaredoxin family protein [Steroidobacteraceae bacterium]|nr:glutaredoxin family protein [Steroidobacteraceae bacterium]
MNESHQWQVLSRADCSLCDTMLLELHQLLGARAAGIQVLDISEDADLQRKYGSRIPVLLIDGECVCTYKLDHQRVRMYL